MLRVFLCVLGLVSASGCPLFAIPLSVSVDFIKKSNPAIQLPITSVAASYPVSSSMSVMVREGTSRYEIIAESSGNWLFERQLSRRGQRTHKFHVIFASEYEQRLAQYLVEDHRTWFLQFIVVRDLLTADESIPFSQLIIETRKGRAMWVQQILEFAARVTPEQLSFEEMIRSVAKQTPVQNFQIMRCDKSLLDVPNDGAPDEP